MDDLESRKAFLRYYRMPEETFDKLVQLLGPHMEKNAQIARDAKCSERISSEHPPQVEECLKVYSERISSEPPPQVEECLKV